MDFTSRVSNFISRHGLIPKNSPVIVGLSGGADSVALLITLQDLGYDVHATHCNFNLRGEESQRDEIFCRDLCHRFNIDLTVRSFNVNSRRRTTGESVEMACRSLRYDWWQQMLSEKADGGVVAVGHHREDNIETFFLNLLRGSSLKGLKGMLPRNGNVIRPLLERSKDEILSYLSERGVDFVTDSSNADNYYKRNRLRNSLLPFIEQEFPGAMISIGQTIDHLRDNFTLYQSMRQELRDKYVDKDATINLNRLVAEQTQPAIVLFELLSGHGFNMSQIEDMITAYKDGISGKYFTGVDRRYLLDRRRLLSVCPEPLNEVVDEVVVDFRHAPFCCRILTLDEFQSLHERNSLNPRALYADSAMLGDKAVFTMRPWRKGDRMRPFGLRGSKLLSDIFSNAKMSVEAKKNVKVILRDKDIIWVPGVRCSAAFPVSDQTEKVIEVIYNPI